MIMKHEHPTDETRELAAIYALGALDREEARDFEAHLREGCPLCEAELLAFQGVVGLLGYSAPEARPRPEVRDRLLAWVGAEATASRRQGQPEGREVAAAQPGLVFVRASEGEWQKTGIEGVTVKRLFVDPVRRSVTMLVRMEPGTVIPRHRHVEAEELYMLEGDGHIAGHVLRAGDYAQAEAGSIHDVTYTEGGCLFLLLSSQRIELLT